MVKIVSEALDAIRSAHLERAREDNDYGHVESCEFAVEEAAEEFDRMIAAVERAAAEKALTDLADELSLPRKLWHGDSGVEVMVDERTMEMQKLTEWLRARAEAYRQERGEQ